MKRNFKVSVSVFIFFWCLIFPRLAAQGEIPLSEAEVAISMDFQDASLKDILKVLSIQSGLNFIASESLQDRRITLYLDKVPLEQAMDKLFKANNLSYELDRHANIFIVKDWGRPQIETETRIFYLKYATVSSSSLKEEMKNNISSTSATTGEGGGGGGEGGGGGGEGGKWKVEEEAGITQAVKKLLSEYGSLIEDFRTNSLIVTDIPSRMPVIASIIAALDVRVPQVMLEVEMLDVSKNVVDKIGFRFGTTPFTVVLSGASMGTMWPFSGTNLPFSAERQFTPGSLAVNTGTNNYTAALDFLRTQTDTKYLARPRILTLNNETAEIKITTQEAVGVKTSTTEATTTAEPERVETGVSLRVTPQVNLELGEITMFIYPKVSEATAGNTLTSGGSSYVYRDPEVRSTKTAVRVKDGETVVIGGLIRNEFTQVKKKLPILGDIPLLGMFFRQRGGDSDKNKERELLVFITPHIVKDNIELAKGEKKATLPEREQDTVFRVDRQAIVASSLNNFEKKK